MIEDFSFEKAKVYLNDLSEEMVILSYIGFTKKYHNLGKHTCAFLKNYYKGTDVMVGRGDKRCVIPVDFLQENDFLYKIESFPMSLRHLTQVNNNLKQSLRTQGILRFEIMKPMTLALDNHQDLLHLISLVKTQSNTLI
jgi:hypothetical protein